VELAPSAFGILGKSSLDFRRGEGDAIFKENNIALAGMEKITVPKR